MDKIYQLWLPVIIWAGLIYIFSNIPSLNSGLVVDFILRKIAHIIEFGVLTFLLIRAFQHSFHLSALDLVIYPITIALAYAVADEFHQTFVPGRHGEIKDVLIDSIGIVGTYIVLYIFQKLSEIKNNKDTRII